VICARCRRQIKHPINVAGILLGEKCARIAFAAKPKRAAVEIDPDLLDVAPAPVARRVFPSHRPRARAIPGDFPASSQFMRVSLMLQNLAEGINEALQATAGEEIAFVLVVQADKVAQYVSNTKRADGAALLEGLLTRWMAGRVDLPAHHNPDLPGPASVQR